ncbi:MAG: gamma-glutamylcyclotransferase [Pseudomonadota bacterium]|nr:gamma-glutamylcyclotransferase [Pseudomonadota bacterium]
MADEPVLPVTRENLSSGSLARLVAERNDDKTRLASDEELLASRRALVPDDADTSDIWVFGYGSLIFNPVMDYVDRARGRIYGHHRRFCLWTRLGRGSPDCPGLVLALDRGGSCTGVAYRLNPDVAIAELDLLWRREMVTLAYRASWLTFHPDGHNDGAGKRAISFVSRPERENFAGPMTLDQEADVIASASGFIGPCRDYLFDTVKALEADGISDPHLKKLQRAVERRLASEEGVG